MRLGVNTAWYVVIALILLIALSGCCPYAFKCGTAEISVREAACPNPQPPKDRSFGETTNALADTVKTYRECRAACIR